MMRKNAAIANLSRQISDEQPAGCTHWFTPPVNNVASGGRLKMQLSTLVSLSEADREPL